MIEKEITVPPISEHESEPEALTISTTPLNIQNNEFIAAIFQQISPNAFAAVCSKSGNPEIGGWPSWKVTGQSAQLY
ncbi:MAG TPA: hypothetical protein PK389_04200, partial [Gammaproteobacteria bacterium]|nr:hypothetical protein [Gammaproteobacteria bacterium]